MSAESSLSASRLVFANVGAVVVVGIGTQSTAFLRLRQSRAVQTTVKSIVSYRIHISFLLCLEKFIVLSRWYSKVGVPPKSKE